MDTVGRHSALICSAAAVHAIFGTQRHGGDPSKNELCSSKGCNRAPPLRRHLRTLALPIASEVIWCPTSVGLGRAWLDAASNPPTVGSGFPGATGGCGYTGDGVLLRLYRTSMRPVFKTQLNAFNEFPHRPVEVFLVSS
jgi:hypothetical protein